MQDVKASSEPAYVTDATGPSIVVGWLIRRPTPGQVGLEHVAGVLLGRGSDRFIGATAPVGDPDRCVDAQKLGAEVAGIGGHARATDMLPLAGEAPTAAIDLIGLLLALGERPIDLALEPGGPADERHEIVEPHGADLAELASVERRRRHESNQQCNRGGNDLA